MNWLPMEAACRRAWRAGIFALVSGPASVALCGAEPADKGERLNVTYSVDDRRLEIEVLGAGAGSYELRIETEGLARPEVDADVNEPGVIYLPPPEGEESNDRLLSAARNIYFVHELREAPGWELVIRFGSAQRGTWKLNGRFSTLGRDLVDELTIPVAELEQGENLIHVRGGNGTVPEMFYRFRVSSSDRLSASLEVVPRDWGGRVSLWSISAPPHLLADRTIVTPPTPPQTSAVPDVAWNDSARLDDAVLAVGKNLLSNRVERRGSLFDGGFNLVYDPSRRAHRMAHWIWAWGPSIDLLLKLSKRDAVHKAGLAETFHSAAVAAAHRSLSFEVTEPNHPAFGVSTVRWEPSRATPNGWSEYMSTADSLFMAGWGWMSAYAETRDPIFLRRMQSLANAAVRLMDQYPVIPQDWIVARNRWTPHTLDESVFGTIGFRRLFEVTNDPATAAAGRRFLDSHLKHMGRASGLLARAWLRDENREIWDPDIKGHAWVVEGYLDAHRLSGDASYLELARQLAEKVMACQAEDGSWTFLFHRPEPEDAIDDKATAIWAYLFYELYKTTRNSAHLDSARRALRWCLRHQDRSSDPNTAGAILYPNSMAYVRRRPLTILYTTTFFGHALLEELALPPTTSPP
ncbi:MAG: hypothetical protein ABIZ04_03930 [Opitutus sp.]